MNVQNSPSPYTSAGASNMPVGNPPVLGSQVPGTTGGLPSMGGLSVLNNPMAQELQSMGRGDDSVLVHMTPGEVNSLQGLAMATGGSLTINPQTGLPEAGWLGKLLPTLLGGLGMLIPGAQPWMLGLAGTVGGTAATGDLSKGLMMGLGAFGGASLAGGIKGALGSGAEATTPGAVEGVTNVADTTLPEVAKNTPFAEAFSGLGEPIINTAVQQGAVNVAPQAAKTGLAGFAQGFGDTAKQGLPGILKQAAVPAAVIGLTNAVGQATTPGYKTSDGKVDNSYQGPYYAQKREANFAPSTEDILSSSKERDYFDIDMPEIYNMQGQTVQPGSSTAPGTQIWQPVLNTNTKKGQPMYTFKSSPWMQEVAEAAPVAAVPFWARSFQPRYAGGGEVDMRDGSFVVDARTVSELGNGSSNAGIEALSRMGGRPVNGPGDGVSDSVPARIGGEQEARVARDEVIFQPDAVRRIGDGSEKRGTQKLYALMDKAHKARKKADRGQDTGLRRGLA